MEIRKNVLVPMRDGVHMALDVYRPDGGGRAPGLLMRTPYLKGGRSGGAGVVPPSAAAVAMPSMEERMRPFVEAGYCVVVSDTRGTGHSEGEYDYYGFVGGPYDGYDTVEWLAAEPFCDGNVGMMGGSAAAVLTYAAANKQPPSLRAIAPNMHPADAYLDQWFVGGVFRYQNRIGWCIGMLDRISPLPLLGAEGDSRLRIRDIHGARFDRYYSRMREGKNPIQMDWLTEMFQHETHGAFWKERSICAEEHRVNVPAYFGGVWYDHFIRGTLSSHAATDQPKKLFVSPGAHGVQGGAGDGGFAATQIRWFDHWLRGEENRILDEPGARLYLMGAERWIDEPLWPLPTDERSYFLKEGGRLSPDPAGAGEPSSIEHDPENPNRTQARPADQRRFEERALTFTSEPFERDVEVIGSCRLVLHASSDAADVDWCVRLSDVFPDGRSRLLNTGALKGSHVFSHEKPEALEPGRVYAFEIEIWAIANLFRAGHRLRITLSTSDFPFFASSDVPSRNHIFHDSRYPSHLVVPVALR